MQKPTIKELGLDLLETKKRHLFLSFTRPFLWLIIFVILYTIKLNLLLPFCVFFLFVSVIHITHDLVHNTLSFPLWLNNILIFISGMFILESGHSYLVTHHLHHKNFPHNEDPEGLPAKGSLIQALISGPLYIPKLFVYAYKSAKQQKQTQLLFWLKVELLTFVAIIICGINWYATYPIILT